jgi:hypothetical protein
LKLGKISCCLFYMKTFFLICLSFARKTRAYPRGAQCPLYGKAHVPPTTILLSK